MMPLHDRFAWDWLLIFACVAFAVTSFVVDPVSAFGVPLAADSTSPVTRALWGWATLSDPLLLEDPPLLRVQTALSVFIYGPFYVLLAIALARRAAFIRVPALVFAGALASNVIIYMVAAFVGYHVARPGLFLAINLPYLMLAIGLILRFARV